MYVRCISCYRTTWPPCSKHVWYLVNRLFRNFRSSCVEISDSVRIIISVRYSFLCRLSAAHYNFFLFTWPRNCDIKKKLVVHCLHQYTLLHTTSYKAVPFATQFSFWSFCTTANLCGFKWNNSVAACTDDCDTPFSCDNGCMDVDVFLNALQCHLMIP